MTYEIYELISNKSVWKIKRHEPNKLYDKNYTSKAKAINQAKSWIEMIGKTPLVEGNIVKVGKPKCLI